ncbi:MAG: hypothetical protein ACU85V_14620 [Gammaproteobacteria bacterium]
MQRIPMTLFLVLSAPLAAAEAPDARQQLRQAFDGAMTCAAITAIEAEKLPPETRWEWDNRSFAFGMLAARFWNDATDNPMSAQDLDNALNKYAGHIVTMTEADLLPFRDSCAQKYADMDKLCKENGCLHAGPPAAPAAAP